MSNEVELLPLVDDALSAGQLFAECHASERNLSKARIKGDWPTILKKDLLSRPLFVGWRQDGEAFSHDDRYPFDFSIMLPRSVKAPGHRYEGLGVAHYIKELPKAELRLLMVARWLGGAGICEPEAILPDRVLKQLVSDFGKRTPYSVTDVYYSRLIKNWMPYFQRLLDEVPTFSTSNKSGLREWLINKRGYDRSAVECTIGPKRNKRSALSVACEWLVRREDIEDMKDEADAGTLRNAYSRVYGNPRLKASNPS